MIKTIHNDPVWGDVRDALLTLMEWAKEEDREDAIDLVRTLIHIVKEAQAEGVVEEDEADGA